MPLIHTTTSLRLSLSGITCADCFVRCAVVCAAAAGRTAHTSRTCFCGRCRTSPWKWTCPTWQPSPQTKPKWCAWFSLRTCHLTLAILLCCDRPRCAVSRQWIRARTARKAAPPSPRRPLRTKTNHRFVPLRCLLRESSSFCRLAVRLHSLCDSS